VWDAATGEPLLQLKGSSYTPHASFSPDGSRVVTCSGNGAARLWDAASGRPLTPAVRHHRTGVVRAAFSPDGRRVVTASKDGTARVWDAASGEPVSPPLVHRN